MFYKKLLYILRKIIKNNCKKKIFFFLKVQSITKNKQNNRIKQQGIPVYQLYIHNEVSSKHIATSILVHFQ